jgi:hypothetical protein
MKPNAVMQSLRRLRAAGKTNVIQFTTERFEQYAAGDRRQYSILMLLLATHLGGEADLGQKLVQEEFSYVAYTVGRKKRVTDEVQDIQTLSNTMDLHCQFLKGALRKALELMVHQDEESEVFKVIYYVLQVFLGILDYATDPEVFEVLDVKSVPSIIWIDKETPASLDQIKLPRKARMKRDKYGQDGEVWRADLIVKFMKDASGIDVGEVRRMQLRMFVHSVQLEYPQPCSPALIAISVLTMQTASLQRPAWPGSVSSVFAVCDESVPRHMLFCIIRLCTCASQVVRPSWKNHPLLPVPFLAMPIVGWKLYHARFMQSPWVWAPVVLAVHCFSVAGGMFDIIDGVPFTVTDHGGKVHYFSPSGKGQLAAEGFLMGGASTAFGLVVLGLAYVGPAVTNKSGQRFVTYAILGLSWALFHKICTTHEWKTGFKGKSFIMG